MTKIELEKFIKNVRVAAAADREAYIARYNKLRDYLDEAEAFPDELADAQGTLERIAEDLDELKQYLEGMVDRLMSGKRRNHEDSER